MVRRTLETKSLRRSKAKFIYVKETKFKRGLLRCASEKLLDKDYLVGLKAIEKFLQIKLSFNSPLDKALFRLQFFQVGKLVLMSKADTWFLVLAIRQQKESVTETFLKKLYTLNLTLQKTGDLPLFPETLKALAIHCYGNESIKAKAKVKANRLSKKALEKAIQRYRVGFFTNRKAFFSTRGGD